MIAKVHHALGVHNEQKKVYGEHTLCTKSTFRNHQAGNRCEQTMFLDFNDPC